MFYPCRRESVQEGLGKARRHNATGSLARADAGVRRRHSALDPGLRRRTPLPEAEAVPPAQQLPLSCFASDGTPPGTFWKRATVPPRTRRPFRIQSAGTSSVVRTHAAELPSERTFGWCPTSSANIILRTWRSFWPTCHCYTDPLLETPSLTPPAQHTGRAESSSADDGYSRSLHPWPSGPWSLV